MADIRFLNSVIVGKRVPAQVYFPESVMLLLRITEIKEFKDGAWGDKVLGYTYECVETMDFRRLRVKIEGQKKPLMSDERLQELRNDGQKVGVEFENLTIMAYVNDKKQSLEDSFKADDATLVSND